MKNYNIETNFWFADKIFNTKIEDSFCDLILKKIYQDKDKWKKGLRNINAFTTGFDGLKKYQELVEISTLISGTLLPKIGKSFNWQYNNWKPASAWVNFYEKGDSASIHNHTGSDFCGILILKPGEGDLLFHDCKFIEGKTKRFEQIEDQRIKEKKGTLILFPSYLYHSVNECRNDRITIAFNFLNIAILEENE